MLVITSVSDDGFERRLTLSKGRLTLSKDRTGIIFRLYKPAGTAFESDLEGILIGSIQVRDEADLKALADML